MIQIDEFDEHNEALRYIQGSSKTVQDAFTVTDVQEDQFSPSHRALAFDDLRIVFFPQGDYEYHVTGPRGEPRATFVRGDHAVAFVIHATLMGEVSV